MRPPRPKANRSPFFFIPVMASPIALAVYLLAFLILIVYTADAFVQWRYRREKSKTYLAVQLVVIISTGAADVVLVILHEREGKEAILHGLQGLSLLQSLVITVCVFHNVNSWFAHNRYRLC
jgi:hypothetical protein